MLKAYSESYFGATDLRDARANLERKGGDREMKWDEHDIQEAVRFTELGIHAADAAQ
jgi:hypothetical protein